MGPLRRLTAILAPAVLALVAAAPGGAERQSFIVFGNEQGGMVVVGAGEGLDGVELNFLPSSSPLPKKFTIQIPAGYTLDVTAKLGEDVADAILSLSGPGSFAGAHGSFVAQDPVRYTTDPTAQACAPGAHAAVWGLATTIAGQDVNVTIFIDPSGDAGGGYLLQSCPTGLSGGGAASSASLTIVDFDLDAPKAAGRYVWHAIVTPQNAPAYELQALVPLPESLRVSARYDAKSKRAVVTGSVVEGGVPAPRVELYVAAEAGGVTKTRTNARGSFNVAIPIRRSSDIDVQVETSPAACEGTSTAPGGCLGSITVPPDGASATVWVSVPGGAARMIRAADQRLAEGENLTAADFTQEFESAGGSGADDCLNPTHESDLTITGESTSDEFVRLIDEPSLSAAAVGGITRVYRSADQARAAFDREAVPATLRCELANLRPKPKVGAVQLTGLPGRVKAFRVAVQLLPGVSGHADLVFLQRGRSTAILTFALVRAPAGVERATAARVASRLR